MTGALIPDEGSEDCQTVKGCWAASLGDCDGKLSREHTISECLFPSGKVTVKGFDWCKDHEKTIGVSGLVRRILCRRHNSELSNLDSAVLKCFESIRESARLNAARSKVKRKSWEIKRFEVDGLLLERWFLKTLINLQFEGTLKFGDYADIPGLPPKEIVEMAFGRRAFDQNAGMYLAVSAGETIAMRDGVSIQVFTERDHLIVAEFTICGYRFILSLVSERVSEFAGSQLLHNKAEVWFRVPNRNNQMIRSHVIQITR